MIATKLDKQMEALEELPRDELVERWSKLHGCLPPKGMKNPMLIRSAGYQLQSKRLGGLKRKTHKALLAIADGVHHKPQPPKLDLKPGMRLMREWHGRTHQVEVLEKGFEWQGEQHTSLSSIATAITGAKWSGPRFFGLREGESL